MNVIPYSGKWRLVGVIHGAELDTSQTSFWLVQSTLVVTDSTAYLPDEPSWPFNIPPTVKIRADQSQMVRLVVSTVTAWGCCNDYPQVEALFEPRRSGEPTGTWHPIA